MAKIRIDIEGILMDGHEVTFKAPCDCDQIDGLKVYFIHNGAQVSREFTMKDAHGHTLTGIGNLFAAGSYVKVLLNTVDSAAYIQNADTNGYLEKKFSQMLYVVGFDSTTGTLTTRSGDYEG